MKNKILLFAFLIFVSSALFAQSYEQYKNINWRIFHSFKWQDKVDYQSEEWKNMPIEEKDLLLQIPDDELNKLTTEELLFVCSNSFYARNIGMFNLIKDHYSYLYENFNGFRELVNRKDIVSVILDYYKNMDLQSDIISFAGLTTKRQIQVLEYIIVCPNILKQFEKSDIKKLIRTAYDTCDKKKSYPVLYHEVDLISTCFLLARCIEEFNEQSNHDLYNINDINLFLESGMFLTTKAKEEIIALGKQL